MSPFFLKITFLYFFLNKSWIWRTLGQVVKIFSYSHFHKASKECFWPETILTFMHGFKSAILEKLPNCQNGTFEPGSAKSRIYAGKSTKRGFSKKAIARIEFFLLV